MFDPYYCIKTQCNVRKPESFEENEPENLYFLWLFFKARGNGTITAWKTPLTGQIPTSCWHHVFTIATMHVTDCDVTFCDDPGMLTVKAAKQVYNSMWIALLKHSFVLVKTWLLIVCGTRLFVWWVGYLGASSTGASPVLQYASIPPPPHTHTL